MMTSNTTYPWFAIQVASRCEKAVAEGLVQRGYNGFLPMYRSRRRWLDRLRYLDLPLFPCYVFCQLDICLRLPVLMIPGVVRFVGLGKTPVPVDEAEIATLRSVVNSGWLLQPWPFLKVGRQVTIEEGPLRKTSGILTEIDGAEQLVVSISLVQRSVALTLPRHAIRPLDYPETWVSPPSLSVPERIQTALASRSVALNLATQAIPQNSQSE